MKTKVLIASPICKPSVILKHFFDSLEALNTLEVEVEYCFIDDNHEETSISLTQDFISRHQGCFLDKDNNYEFKAWHKEEHTWTSDKIEKVAYYKNQMITYFLKGEWEYLFFVDADLVLHPQTLRNLIDNDKDIISNIFWTKWTENDRPLPQVWLKDFYTLYDAHMLRVISKEAIAKEEGAFLEKLRQPGVYKVGGLGACTLIKRKVLETGVHFGNIYNLSFWGEDRSFCIRAVALGFELYVATHYPAYHIFRKEELDGVEAFKKIRRIE